MKPFVLALGLSLIGLPSAAPALEADASKALEGAVYQTEGLLERLPSMQSIVDTLWKPHRDSLYAGPLMKYLSDYPEHAGDPELQKAVLLLQGSSLRARMAADGVANEDATNQLPVLDHDRTCSESDDDPDTDNPCRFIFTGLATGLLGGGAAMLVMEDNVPGATIGYSLLGLGALIGGGAIRSWADEWNPDHVAMHRLERQIPVLNAQMKWIRLEISRIDSEIERLGGARTDASQPLYQAFKNLSKESIDKYRSRLGDEVAATAERKARIRADRLAEERRSSQENWNAFGSALQHSTERLEAMNSSSSSNSSGTTYTLPKPSSSAKASPSEALSTRAKPETRSTATGTITLTAMKLNSSYPECNRKFTEWNDLDVCEGPYRKAENERLKAEKAAEDERNRIATAKAQCLAQSTRDSHCYFLENSCKCAPVEKYVPTGGPARVMSVN